MPLSVAPRFEEGSRSEWESLLARAARPSPFLSPSFLLPWTSSFAGSRPVRIVRWERDGRAEGLLFLYLPGEGGEWELLGGEQVADSLDLLVAAGRDAEFWEEFLPRARDLLDPAPRAIRLPGLVEASPTPDLLPPLCGRLGFPCAVEETDRSPYLPLPGSFEEYLSGLGKKERHELRRKIRRAGEAFPDLALRIPSDPRDLPRDLDSFVALHRKSHPEKQEFMDDRMERFFRDLARMLLARGALRLAILSGGGRDLAAAFQIAWGRSVLLYNSGFDPAFREASPGLVLLARCIGESIREGASRYDFLRGRERYKYDLGAADRPVFRAVIRFP